MVKSLVAQSCITGSLSAKSSTVELRVLKNIFFSNQCDLDDNM